MLVTALINTVSVVIFIALVLLFVSNVYELVMLWCVRRAYETHDPCSFFIPFHPLLTRPFREMAVPQYLASRAIQRGDVPVTAALDDRTELAAFSWVSRLTTGTLSSASTSTSGGDGQPHKRKHHLSAVSAALNWYLTHTTAAVSKEANRALVWGIAMPIELAAETALQQQQGKEQRQQRLHQTPSGGAAAQVLLKQKRMKVDVLLAPLTQESSIFSSTGATSAPTPLALNTAQNCGTFGGDGGGGADEEPIFSTFEAAPAPDEREEMRITTHAARVGAQYAQKGKGYRGAQRVAAYLSTTRTSLAAPDAVLMESVHDGALTQRLAGATAGRGAWKQQQELKRKRKAEMKQTIDQRNRLNALRPRYRTLLLASSIVTERHVMRSAAERHGTVLPRTTILWSPHVDSYRNSNDDSFAASGPGVSPLAPGYRGRRDTLSPLPTLAGQEATGGAGMPAPHWALAHHSTATTTTHGNDGNVVESGTTTATPWLSPSAQDATREFLAGVNAARETAARWPQEHLQPLQQQQQQLLAHTPHHSASSKYAQPQKPATAVASTSVAAIEKGDRAPWRVTPSLHITSIVGSPSPESDTEMEKVESLRVRELRVAYVIGADRASLLRALTVNATRTFVHDTLNFLCFYTSEDEERCVRRRMIKLDQQNRRALEMLRQRTLVPGPGSYTGRMKLKHERRLGGVAAAAAATDRMPLSSLSSSPPSLASAASAVASGTPYERSIGAASPLSETHTQRLDVVGPESDLSATLPQFMPPSTDRGDCSSLSATATILPSGLSVATYEGIDSPAHSQGLVSAASHTSVPAGSLTTPNLQKPSISMSTVVLDEAAFATAQSWVSSLHGSAATLSDTANSHSPEEPASPPLQPTVGSPPPNISALHTPAEDLSFFSPSPGEVTAVMGEFVSTRTHNVGTDATDTDGGGDVEEEGLASRKAAVSSVIISVSDFGVITEMEAENTAAEPLMCSGASVCSADGEVGSYAAALAVSLPQQVFLVAEGHVNKAVLTSTATSSNRHVRTRKRRPALPLSGALLTEGPGGVEVSELALDTLRNRLEPYVSSEEDEDEDVTNSGVDDYSTDRPTRSATAMMNVNSYTSLHSLTTSGWEEHGDDLHEGGATTAVRVGASTSRTARRSTAADAYPRYHREPPRSSRARRHHHHHHRRRDKTVERARREARRRAQQRRRRRRRVSGNVAGADLPVAVAVMCFVPPQPAPRSPRPLSCRGLSTSTCPATPLVDHEGEAGASQPSSSVCMMLVYGATSVVIATAISTTRAAAAITPAPHSRSLARGATRYRPLAVSQRYHDHRSNESPPTSRPPPPPRRPTVAELTDSFSAWQGDTSSAAAGSFPFSPLYTRTWAPDLNETDSGSSGRFPHVRAQVSTSDTCTAAVSITTTTQGMDRGDDVAPEGHEVLLLSDHDLDSGSDMDNDEISYGGVGRQSSGRRRRNDATDVLAPVCDAARFPGGLAVPMTLLYIRIGNDLYAVTEVSDRTFIQYRERRLRDNSQSLVREDDGAGQDNERQRSVSNSSISSSFDGTSANLEKGHPLVAATEDENDLSNTSLGGTTTSDDTAVTASKQQEQQVKAKRRSRRAAVSMLDFGETTYSLSGSAALMPGTQRQLVHMCLQCLSTEATVIFLPCGHFAVCSGCAEHYASCCVCSAMILSTVTLAGTE